METLELIREVCNKILIKYKNNTIEYKKYSQIQKTLSDDNFFNKISFKSSINMLQELGLDRNESIIAYADIVRNTKSNDAQQKNKY